MKSYKIWLLGLCMSVASLGAQAAVISILAPANVELGTSFDAQVFIDDVPFTVATEGFGGFQFDLTFSNADLAATTLVSGDIFGIDTFPIDNTIDNPGGIASLAETTLGFGLDITTPTLLGTLTFLVDANAAIGSSNLGLTNVVLSDGLAAVITNVTIQDSSVNITSPSAAPIPSSLWLMSLSLALCGTWRRARRSAAA